MLKFFSMVWSFSWEALLGKQSFIEALRKNKAKLLFVVVMSISLTGNYYLTGKLALLGRDHVELQRSYDAVVKPKQTELPVKEIPKANLKGHKDDPSVGPNRNNVKTVPTTVEAVEKEHIVDTLRNIHVE